MEKQSYLKGVLGVYGDDFEKRDSSSRQTSKRSPDLNRKGFQLNQDGWGYSARVSKMKKEVRTLPCQRGGGVRGGTHVG